MRWNMWLLGLATAGLLAGCPNSRGVNLSVVSGQVLVDGAGQAERTVRLERRAGGDWSTVDITQTDAAGNYQLTGLDPGEHRVTLLDPPEDAVFDALSHGFIVTDTGTEFVFDFIGTRLGAVLATVTIDDEPAADITVTVRDGELTAHVTITLASGEARFDAVHPGAYTLEIEAPAGTAFPFDSSEIIVAGGEEAVVHFRGTDGALLFGRLTADGQPLADAFVSAQPVDAAGNPVGDPVVAQTDGLGEFWNPVVAGTYQVRPEDEFVLFVPEFVELELAAGQAERVDFAGKSGGMILGVVTDGIDARPGATVRAGEDLFSVTDAQGQYRFLLPPSIYTIRVEDAPFFGDGWAPPEAVVEVQAGSLHEINFQSIAAGDPGGETLFLVMATAGTGGVQFHSLPDGLGGPIEDIEVTGLEAGVEPESNSLSATEFPAGQHSFEFRAFPFIGPANLYQVPLPGGEASQVPATANVISADRCPQNGARVVHLAGEGILFLPADATDLTDAVSLSAEGSNPVFEAACGTPGARVWFDKTDASGLESHIYSVLEDGSGEQQHTDSAGQLVFFTNPVPLGTRVGFNRDAPAGCLFQLKDLVSGEVEDIFNECLRFPSGHAPSGQVLGTGFEPGSRRVLFYDADTGEKLEHSLDELPEGRSVIRVRHLGVRLDF